MSPRHVNNSYIPTSIATVNQNMSIHSMADMRQRLPNEIGPITFRLKMVQEPKRMLGIGDKPNRGRIHPQPIVQLEPRMLHIPCWNLCPLLWSQCCCTHM